MEQTRLSYKISHCTAIACCLGLFVSFDSFLLCLTQDPKATFFFYQDKYYPQLHLNAWTVRLKIILITEQVSYRQGHAYHPSQSDKKYKHQPYGEWHEGV